MLHATSNSELALIITKAWKTADLETQVATSEHTLTEMDHPLSQRQNAEIILRNNLEDLNNRDWFNKLFFVGIPESVKE